MKEVWFWQLIISPHMIKVAKELTKLGIKVNYVVQQEMSDDRRKLGWTADSLGNINLFFYMDNLSEILTKSDKNAIHILQGLRGNGYICEVAKFFKENNINFWVILETVNTVGFKGYLKKYLYMNIYSKFKKNITGFLSIGYTSPQWLQSIGVDRNKIYPFTYFLDPSVVETDVSDNFIFIFVGNLIERKRPQLILESLSKINSNVDFELWIVGDGVLRDHLITLNKKLNLNIKWLGNQPINRVRQFISNADCLILPSFYDGWGAVASEAIIEGTPVICSSSCGVAEVVALSNEGGVFNFKNEDELYYLIDKQIENGKFSTQQRQKLKKWGKCLTAETGASYLEEILFEKSLSNNLAPWKVEK